MGEAPEIPPSIEHLVHEAQRWRADTQIGRILDSTGAVEVIARNMVHHVPGVDPRAIGNVLIRLASLLANEPDMPTPMVINLVGAVGADLISRDVAREMFGDDR